MQRRPALLRLALAAPVCFSVSAATSPSAAVEGKDYARLSTTALPATAPGKVAVLSFFWYECPTCNAFDAKLSEWSKRLSADVSFRHVPVGFARRHQTTQRLFFALERMGLLQTLHAQIYTAIHREGRRVFTEEDLLALLSSRGVSDTARFLELYRSPDVARQCAAASALVDSYRVEGVPAIGVGGRFLTSPSMAGDQDACLKVADELVALSRQQR